MNIKGLLLAAALSIPLLAMASEAFDVQEVIVKQERLRRAVDSGAAGFSEVPSAKKQEVLQRQDELLALIRGRSYAELSEAERTQANEQITWLDRTATQVADERLVCERTKVAGTNRVTRVCMTARRKREALEEAQKSMTGPKISPQYDLTTPGGRPPGG